MIPFRLKSLDHVVLRVSEVRTCVSFYCDVLGCSVEQEHADLGLYQLRAGDFIIDLLDVAGPIGREGGSGPSRDGHNLDHFCIRVEPFDELASRKHFARHNVKPSDLLNNWGGDGRGPSMYVLDPEGNKVEIKGPPAEPYRH